MGGFFSPRDAAGELRTSLRSHMHWHTAAYGTQYIRLKHHWGFDVCEQIVKDGLVLDAFVVERMHLQVKGIADHVRNTSVFEKSVMAGVLNVQMQRAREANSVQWLRGSLQRWQSAWLAPHMCCSGLLVSVGDIIFRGTVAGQILACAVEDDTAYVLVEELVKTSTISTHSDSWTCMGGRAVWRAAHLEQTLAWYVRLDGHTVIIRM